MPRNDTRTANDNDTLDTIQGHVEQAYLHLKKAADLHDTLTNEMKSNTTFRIKNIAKHTAAVGKRLQQRPPGKSPRI